MDHQPARSQGGGSERALALQSALWKEARQVLLQSELLSDDGLRRRTWTWQSSRPRLPNSMCRRRKSM